MLDRNFNFYVAAPKMKSHMSLVSWESESCEELDRHYRALGVIVSTWFNNNNDVPVSGQAST